MFGGRPAKYLGELTEGNDMVMSEFCNNYYKNLIITQNVSKHMFYFNIQYLLDYELEILNQRFMKKKLLNENKNNNFRKLKISIKIVNKYYD